LAGLAAPAGLAEEGLQRRRRQPGSRLLEGRGDDLGGAEPAGSGAGSAGEGEQRRPAERLFGGGEPAGDAEQGGSVVGGWAGAGPGAAG
jgi:hypothetical protein